MSIHKTVLLNEAVDNLNLDKDSIVVDATLGGGGHTLKILGEISTDGKLIAIDRDIEAIERFKKNNKNKNLVLVNDNFSNIGEILNHNGIEKVDAIIADFGLSSDQLESRKRGFSFLFDSELDMRMDQSQELTARDVVNKYPEEDLRRIFWEFGEEKYSSSIARNIVKTREEKEIKNIDELVRIIDRSVPDEYKRQRIHFATKVFQALRIEVNNELSSIERFVKASVERLKSGGRLSVISFHSGEDRIVKKIFKNLEKGCACPPDFPVCQCGEKSQIKIITKKPILASEKEKKENPRSRSAKLRVAEKLVS